VNTDAVVAESLKRQLRAWSRWNWNGWDEAANYLLDHKGSAEDALAYADHSISVEERFDNLMTRSHALDRLGRTPEAATARQKALAMGSALQLHGYGRELQLQGQQEEAFRIFRLNQQRFPDHWIVRSEVARMACAKGDFDTAIREMKAAAAGASVDYKPGMERLVKRLEAKEDINK
jgi:tetratricopeptide (TPR) repeat protein